MPKTPPPTRRGRIPAPSSFRLVEASVVGEVVFGSKVGRESAYLKALQELLDRPGALMEVDSLTARSGIAAQAKKNGITVLFGEKSGKLYVKVMGKESAEDLVLKRLEDGPMNLVEIESLLEKARRPEKASDLTKILSESGKIALRTVPGSQAKKWYAV